MKSVSVRTRLVVTKVLSQDFKTKSARLTSNAGVVYLPRQETNGGEELNQSLLVPVTDETVTEID